MDIRWTVGISYIDMLNQRHFTSYSVNAKSKLIAENISRELFLMEYGVSEGMDILVEPERLSQGDLARMYKIKDTSYVELCLEFSKKNYKEFVLAFQQFDGFSSKFSTTEDSHFWFYFLGLTLKAVFTVNGDCYLDSNEIFFQGNTGNKILVRNNWSEYYYCVG